MPELVLPDTKYKKSYLEALEEYQPDSRFKAEDVNKDFESYITRIRNESFGIDLPVGYVAHTVYWLVDGDMFLGQVDIRHQLNESLKNEGGHIGYYIRPTQRNKGYGTLALRLGIQKAHELGIKDVLVTCDVDNVSSSKVIQKNGGVLEDTYQIPNGALKNRYWIKQ